MAKIRITSLGKNAKQLNWPVNPGMLSEPDVEVNSTLQPVDRQDANLEAEKGETAVADLTGSGIPQQYKIAGKPHSQGGTPLDLPKDSFIFSKDKSMYIKDEEILKMFGLAPRKGGYAPAEIAKKYDLNRYHKVLADPDTDDLQRDTAEMMIAQYNLKLAKLAMVQESLKGFPTGIPKIAEPYMESGAINPEDLNITQAMPENPGQSEEGQMQRQFGGNMPRKVRIVALPKAQDGTEVGKYAKVRPSNEISDDEVQDKAYDPRYDVAKKYLKRVYDSNTFNAPDQPYFGMPQFNNKGKVNTYRNTWDDDDKYNLTHLNINKLWQEEKDAKPLYTTGSPKRDLNKYIGTQKAEPKKLPGKTEAKKALTFDEKLKAAQEYTKNIKPEGPSFWSTLADDVNNLGALGNKAIKRYFAPDPLEERKRAEALLDASMTLPKGLKTKIPKSKMTYEDAIVQHQLRQAEAEAAQKIAEQEYQIALGKVNGSVKQFGTQKPSLKTKLNAQPYANFDDYWSHLKDPYSEEKRAKQIAYMKAHPDEFPDAFSKKRFGGLSQYKGGGTATKGTGKDASKTFYSDGSMQDKRQPGKWFNHDGSAWIEPDPAAPPVTTGAKSTGSKSSGQSQPSGNYNYKDRDKFSKDAIQAGGYDVIYGPDNLKKLPSQKFDPKTNTYYHLDENGNRIDVNMDDFSKRHAWFKDAIQGMNAVSQMQGMPTIDADKIFADMQSPDKATRERATNMFQTAHSRMSKKIGAPQYFTEGNNPNDPTSIDSKFGNYTENAPVFRRSATTTPETGAAADKKTNTGAGIKENPLIPQYEAYPDAWFPQDLNNIAMAQRIKARIPNEMEWGAIASAHKAPYVLRSPERALAANTEAFNVGAQNMAAFAPSASVARASMSGMAGKSAANAANIEAQVEDANVDTQNRAFAMNADIANRFGMYEAGEKNDQYHNQLGMNREKISALNKSDREIVRNINQGMDNSRDAYNTNLLNDNYKIDPRGAGRIYFTDTGRKIQANTPQEEMATKFLKLKERMPGASDETILKVMGLG
jgi:hypothetical protein